MAIAFWPVNPFDKYQGVHLNGMWWTKAQLFAGHFTDSDHDNLKEAKAFAAQLFNQDKMIEVQTSGSTGVPKKMTFAKAAFEQSALASNTFFGLNAESKTALPLPMQYIAGKMMVVRAIVGNHHLTILEPSGNPLEEIGEIDFIPVTPFQFSKVIANPEVNNIGTFLIGGGAINAQLIKEISKTGINAYSSFGMTETLSHFALANIEESSDLWYQPLPGVSVRIDASVNLEINWPGITSGWLKTGDMVELKEGAFKWLGRSDYLINSGGIKLIPEEIEAELAKHIDADFFVFGVQHPVLGQEAVLFIEGEPTELNLSEIKWQSPYHKPKSVHIISAFSRTISGKVKRKETVEYWVKSKK